LSPFISTLVVAALILPAVLGALTLLALRYRLGVSRLVSRGSCLALVGVAAALTVHASGGTVESYALGNWAPPVGIEFRHKDGFVALPPFDALRRQRVQQLGVHGEQALQQGQLVRVVLSLADRQIGHWSNDHRLCLQPLRPGFG